MSKTHWKKLTNPDYLGAYSLDPGEERAIEIIKVSREMITGPDGKKEECTVAFLKAEKPMILNVTNCKTIAKILGTPFIEEWAGKRVTVYVEKVKAFGEMVDALRIKDKPAELPELLPDTQAWEGAIKALRAGTHKMSDIKKKFRISLENESALIDHTNA